MPGVQQNLVVKKEQAEITDKVFMGMPVYTSSHFIKIQPRKYYKRLRNKRLFKKWVNRYGCIFNARTDADICSGFVLCHPSVLWRFNYQEFISIEGENIKEGEHDIHL